jgi:site-specific DNA recombinase
MSPQNRAVLYARVSTPRQAELYSLDYQIQQEQSYTSEAGLRVVAEFKDDQSGRRMERDGLEEACQMLERDEADILVVWKFDRLHRHYVNSVLMRERIKKAGKQIHYAQSKIVSGKTARERLPEDLQFIMAEIDADDILERTNQGRANKIKSGKWFGSNKPPYGYLKIGQRNTATFVIDDYEHPDGKEKTEELLARCALGEVVPEVLAVVREGKATAVVVRWIYVWYARGYNNLAPFSSLEIADRLTELKIPTPQDLLPNRVHLKARGYAQWGRSNVHHLLRQPAYSGTFFHNRQKLVNGKHTRNYNMDEYLGVPVPRIVDEALYLAVQKKLDEGKLMSPRGAKYEALVGRRIKCECGFTLQSYPSYKKHTLKDGTERSYKNHRYTCPGRSRILNPSHKCDMPTVDVEYIDEVVWQWLKEEIANPEILQRKLEEIQAEQQANVAGYQSTLDMLYEHRAQIEEELKQLGKLYTTEMPKHIVEGLISEQSHKLQLTNAEIRKRESEKDDPITNDTITTLIGLSWQLSEHMAAIENDYDAKRVVVDNLDVRVELVRDNGEQKLRLRSILRPDIISRVLFNTPSTTILNINYLNLAPITGTMLPHRTSICSTTSRKRTAQGC